MSVPPPDPANALTVRAVLKGIVGMVLLAFLAPGPATAEGTAFSRALLIDAARALAQEPFVDRSGQVPQSLSALGYDQYRDIRSRQDATLWLNDSGTFSIDLLPAGFIYSKPVEVWLVEDGQAHPLYLNRDQVDVGPLVEELLPEGQLPLSGFRLRYPLAGTDVQDEVAVFQGASYYRAIGKGGIYGLSARGLAINTGRPEGEEFPYFRGFWIERPVGDAQAVVVHALLDSPATTGVYRFTIRPGAPTVIDVEMVLFPRQDIPHVGLAPFSSMFLFDDINRDDFTDHRSAVHDSDGLSIWSGNGRWLWRPLDNPDDLRISAFQESGPRGFGLVQRKRFFDDYQDAEARYELRPSAWVEPVGDWGRGAVTLLEIPTRRETNDNIAVYWQPHQGIAAGETFSLTYRVHWDALPPARPGLARVERTRLGLGPNKAGQVQAGTALPFFVVDYAFDDTVPQDIQFNVESSAGHIRNLAHYPLPVEGRFRVAFELDPDGATEAELRIDLESEGTAGETWLYRWNE